MTSLEQRYRRLLTWYPKEHRTLHAEEMIAVLLTGAAPGQNRPTARDAFDLVRGGLSIRLHRAVGPESRRHWRDAVNLAALLAPIPLLLSEVTRASAYAGEALRGHSGSGVALHTLVFALPYGLIALLAWLRRGRVAAACAWGWTVLHTWLITSSPDLGLSPVYVMSYGGGKFITSDLWSAWPVVLPVLLCAAMLTFAPSPGPASLGTARLLGWMAAVFAAFVASTQLPSSWGSHLPLLVLVAVMVVALYFPVGRRTVVTLLPLLAVQFGWVSWEWDPSMFAALSAAVLAITAWLARTGNATSTSVGG
ncbi:MULTISPECIES: hypothetical protein [unclassified Streptosporangium]|uniref:hypothetical protein n=1 Tax=unclassified Streptosporangium TaxID=2632669 RepID=UPI002E27AF39|nr:MULTISPECIES: hypothetical protein [unclassified Streptosporangium]